MELYVVRHGQTDGNVQQVIDGIRDIPLTEVGKVQAINARNSIEGIKFDLVVCSPLTRTKQTMELLTENKFPVIYESKIIERDCGELMGKSFSEVDLDKYWNYNDKTQYETAENIKDFFARIHGYLDFLKNEYKNKTILIVTHGGVYKAIHCYFNGIPKGGSLRKITINNCEVVKFSV